MKSILTFKPWLLFLLMVIPGAWSSPSPLNEIIHLIGIATWTVWIYSIGFWGQEVVAKLGLPALNMRLFTINCMLIPFSFVIFIFFVFNQTADNTPSGIIIQSIVLILAPFHLIVAILHTAFFACKTFATIELNREVTFGDYAGNFMLMLFFFIGVWIIQPKVTRLIANNETPPLA